VPRTIEGALHDLRKNMRTAWGEEIEDGIALARHARQLACGFYYRWRWPNDVPDQEWLYARADWHKELRLHLKRNIPGCDSPFLVASAIARGDIESEFYMPWCAVRDRYKPHPPVEAVWLSDFLIHDIVKWLNDPARKGRGIAWFEHSAVANRLRQFGVTVFGSGARASRGIMECKGGPIAASVKAHGTGKNLQDRWSDNLVISCPPSGEIWQQLLARTHRPLQEADEVTCEVYQHTTELRDAWGKALVLAEYMQDSDGPQKLLFADLVDFELDTSSIRVKLTA